MQLKFLMKFIQNLIFLTFGLIKKHGAIGLMKEIKELEIGLNKIISIGLKKSKMV